MKYHSFKKLAAACAAMTAAAAASAFAFNAGAAGLAGDANCDNNVDISDAVIIMQSLSNPSKYSENGSDAKHLTAEGALNGDVNLRGNGISNADALTIQKYLLDSIQTLPESYAQGQPDDNPTTSSTSTTTTTTTTQPWQQPTTSTTTTTAPVNPSTNLNTPDLGTPMNANATAVADFRKGSTPLFFASDGWENGDPFDCGWYKGQTSLDSGVLTLTIDKDKTGKYNYAGAEYRTSDHYGYGYYETSMQAIANDGVVSSFFTYTGPSENNPWDEIDIEILGKDPTKVQFNYYTNGQGNHEFMYDLGFDSSKAFHTYGFDWQPDHITWYVDGKPVYTANQNIPKTEGRIMMNTWPGRGVDGWLNHYNGNTPLTARYQWVTFNKGGAGNNNQQTQTTQQPWQQPTTTSTTTTTTTTQWQWQPTTTTTTQPVHQGAIADKGTPMDTSATMISDFRTGNAGDFFASDGWTNGKPFDCWWYKQNAQIKGDHLELSVDRKWTNDSNPDWNPAYSGGEFRTNKFYSYGYYETSMQAIKNDGVVSSFFTYTGPSDDNPWDEIDIEILGKDTTKVQLNYYTNGVGNHEKMIDLGFDSSLEYHTYGFDWQPDYIAWYIDGKEVYRATDNIPKTAGKIMMNAWPGKTVDDWLKAYNGNTPLTARYQWVTYKNSPKNGGNNNQWQNPWQPQQTTQTTTQGWQQPVTTTQTQVNVQNNGMNKNATMVSDFTTGNAGDFFASDGWTNGKPFDCWWYKQNAQIKGDHLELSVDRKWSNDSNPDWNPAYSGGEFRTNNFYHYGYYETSMKAIKNDGVVSSFFTYTGPSDNNPWDEIDIEILGKDTTKVQLNYYTNGVGNHEKMIDLGFDSSQEYHRFGFDWQPSYIAWYIDGKEVYRAYDNIPKTPGKIMMNAWPGKTVDDWLKAYNGRTPLTAYYQWVTYNKQ